MVKNFQGKKKQGPLKRILYSPLGMVIFGIVFMVFASGVVDFMLKMRDTSKNKDIAEQKVAELEKRKQKLVNDISELNTDKGKEKVFREDFGLAKEGEGLIIVVEDESGGKDSSLEGQSEADIFSLRNFFIRFIK